jgi:hypothetical protein
MFGQWTMRTRRLKRVGVIHMLARSWNASIIFFFKSIFKLLKDQINPTQLVNNKKKKTQPEMTSICLVVRFKFFASKGMNIFIMLINMLKDSIDHQQPINSKKN